MRWNLMQKMKNRVSWPTESPNFSTFLMTTQNLQPFPKFPKKSNQECTPGEIPQMLSSNLKIFASISSLLSRFDRELSKFNQKIIKIIPAHIRAGPSKPAFPGGTPRPENAILTSPPGIAFKKASISQPLAFISPFLIFPKNAVKERN